MPITDKQFNDLEAQVSSLEVEILSIWSQIKITGYMTLELYNILKLHLENVNHGSIDTSLSSLSQKKEEAKGVGVSDSGSVEKK